MIVYIIVSDSCRLWCSVSALSSHDFFVLVIGGGIKWIERIVVKELVDDGQRSVNQPGSTRCDDVNSNHHEPSATCVKRSSVDEF